MQKPRPITRAAVPAVAAFLLATMLATAATGKSANQVARMPGEMVLTKDQQAQALAGMDPKERAQRTKQWSAEGVLPVAYASAHYKLVRGLDGVRRPQQVGVYAVSASPNFRVPSDVSSDAVALAGTTGSASKYDLSISTAVVRRSCSGCYEWAIDNYADWHNRSPQGADYDNRTEDLIGSSWAGDLYIQSDSSAGRYTTAPGGTEKSIPIYRSDVTPNRGIGWSFYEWVGSCGLGLLKCAADWADGTVFIRETSWKSRTDNTAYKYTHTWGDNGSSLSMSFGAATITVNGGGSEKWSLATYASFSH